MRNREQLVPPVVAVIKTSWASCWLLPPLPLRATDDGLAAIDWTKHGTFEFTADWWGVETTKGVSQAEFEQQVNQKYQYHNVKQACEEKGYAVEEELNEEDGSIRLVVRKWVSE